MKRQRTATTARRTLAPVMHRLKLFLTVGDAARLSRTATTFGGDRVLRQRLRVARNVRRLNTGGIGTTTMLSVRDQTVIYISPLEAVFESHQSERYKAEGGEYVMYLYNDGRSHGTTVWDQLKISILNVWLRVLRWVQAGYVVVPPPARWLLFSVVSHGLRLGFGDLRYSHMHERRRQRKLMDLPPGCGDLRVHLNDWKRFSAWLDPATAHILTEAVVMEINPKAQQIMASLRKRWPGLVDRTYNQDGYFQSALEEEIIEGVFEGSYLISFPGCRMKMVIEDEYDGSSTEIMRSMMVEPSLCMTNPDHPVLTWNVTSWRWSYA